MGDTLRGLLEGGIVDIHDLVIETDDNHCVVGDVCPVGQSPSLR